MMKFAMVLLFGGAIGSFVGRMINSIPIRFISGIISAIGAFIIVFNALRMWFFLF